MKREAKNKKFPRRVRDKAFNLYRKHDQNATAVKRELAKEGIKIQVSTITRWAKMEDWEAKIALVENEFQRLLRNSDDPIIRQIALDDLEMARTLGILYKLVQDALKKPKQSGLLPRTPNELIKYLEYIRTERERIINGKVKKDKETGGNTFIDNRSVNFIQNEMKRLPKDQQIKAMKMVRNHLQSDKKLLVAARKDAFEEE